MRWDDYGDGWGMHDGYGAGWIMLAVMVLLLVVLVGILVALLLRQPGPTAGASEPPSYPPPTDAKEILRRRFAAGEIDEDEFRSRQEALAGHIG